MFPSFTPCMGVGYLILHIELLNMQLNLFVIVLSTIPQNVSLIFSLLQYVEMLTTKLKIFKVHYFYFSVHIIVNFKGIGSILFLKNGLKKFCRKNYQNHLRSNNYEVCTAVALYFPNILDVLVLQNINLSSDRNRVTIVVV
jgi:hypothetical protein